MKFLQLCNLILKIELAFLLVNIVVIPILFVFVTIVFSMFGIILGN